MRLAQRLQPSPTTFALLVLLGLALTASACLPGERSNAPLPDVKVDTAVADGSKSDTKADAAPVDGSSDAPTDAAEDATGTDQDVQIVGPLGCKGDGDCLPATLPCQSTPTCNAETGLCESVQSDETSPCSTDPCLVGEACDAAGACVGGKPKDCSDGNACTFDLCGNGVCSHPLANASCTDNVQCTVSDHCVAGTCVGTPLDCGDGNPCTDDTCNEKGDASVSVFNICKHTGFDYAAKVVACTPTDPTLSPFCDNAACGVVKNCDDKNPCTSDAPNTLTGECENTYVGDGVTCGSDKCHPGTCKLVDSGGVSLPACVTIDKCDDGKACTKDLCDATGKCDNKTTLAQGTSCVTTDPCVINGQCDGKTKCVSTTPVVCNDGNPCTDDVCIAGLGCTGTATTKVTSCNDGNGCTIGDTCTNGVCGGTAANCDDANACTLDACDALTGCKHTLQPDGTDCGNSSACSQGICKAK